MSETKPEEKVELIETTAVKELTDETVEAVTKEESTVVETVEKKEGGGEKKKKFQITMFSRDRSGERKKKDATKENAPEGEGKGDEGKGEKDALLDKEQKEGLDADAPKKEAKSTFKPTFQWVQKKAKTATKPKKERLENGMDHEGDEMTIGINMLDRDEKGLNDFIKLNFEDVLAEPDPYHSVGCNWRATNKIFMGTRSFMYKLLSLIVAIPCALFWGIIFAFLSCLHIWACVPGAKAAAILLTWPAKAWEFLIGAIFNPIFRSVGLCCSAMRLQHNRFSNSPSEMEKVVAEVA